MKFFSRPGIQQSSTALENGQRFYREVNLGIPDWIFNRNSFTERPHLASLLNLIIVQVKIVGLAFYLALGQQRWMYSLITVDIFLNAVSWWLLVNSREKLIHHTKVESKEIHRTELFSTGIKLMVLLLLFSSAELQVFSVGTSLCAIVVLFSLHLALDYFRTYKALFSSVFNLCNFLAVALLFCDQVCDAWLSWDTLIWSYSCIQWFSIAAFFNYFSVVGILLALQVSKRKSLSDCTSYKAHLAVSFKYLISYLLYRCLVTRLQSPQAEQSQDDLKELAFVAVASVGYYLFYTCVEITFDKELEAFSREHFQVDKKPQITMKKHTGLRLVRRSSTYFVQKQSGPPSVEGTISSGHSNQGKEQATAEAHKCLVCCVSEANCISLSCMHAGICSNCLAKSCGPSNRCIICRQDLKKLAIISRISKNEYQVEKEIRLVAVSQNANSTLDIRQSAALNS